MLASSSRAANRDRRSVSPMASELLSIHSSRRPRRELAVSPNMKPELLSIRIKRTLSPLCRDHRDIGRGSHARPLLPRLGPRERQAAAKAPAERTHEPELAMGVEHDGAAIKAPGGR